MSRMAVTRLLFALLVVAIVAVSLAPGDDRALGTFDKLGHFLAYGLLVFVGLAGFPGRPAAAAVVLFSLLLGLGLEVVQAAIGSREASWLDELANLLGVAVGVAAHWLFQRPVATRLR